MTRTQTLEHLLTLAAIGRAAVLAARLTALVLATGRAAAGLCLGLRGLCKCRNGEDKTHGQQCECTLHRNLLDSENAGKCQARCVCALGCFLGTGVRSGLDPKNSMEDAKRRRAQRQRFGSGSSESRFGIRGCSERNRVCALSPGFCQRRPVLTRHWQVVLAAVGRTIAGRERAGHGTLRSHLADAHRAMRRRRAGERGQSRLNYKQSGNGDCNGLVQSSHRLNTE